MQLRLSDCVACIGLMGTVFFGLLSLLFFLKNEFLITHYIHGGIDSGAMGKKLLIAAGFYFMKAMIALNVSRCKRKKE
jgi:hypothetical protein